MYKEMSIGNLARRTGCKVETIRYYEHCGLMPKPPRTNGGHRVYNVDHLKRLTFIRRSRDLGFAMTQIKSLLQMAQSDQHSCGEIAQAADKHLDAVRTRIHDLQKMQNTLNQILAQCHRGDTPDCAIIDALFTPNERDD